MKKLLCKLYWLLNTTRHVDFLGPVALRVYLVPVFYMAGMNKIYHINDVAMWFQYTLHLPFPKLMAYLATYAELIGTLCLALGFALRWACIPLMITMLVAIFKVHWMNGWYAIAAQGSDAAMRIHEHLAWLKATFPDKHMALTALGKPVISNNGVEFAVTYFVMLLVLFFIGAGNYFSVDYWIKKFCCKKQVKTL